MKRSLRRNPHSVPSVTHDSNQTGALDHFLIESLTEFAVFAVSPGGIIISWNSGARQTFGYTAAEAIGQDFSIIFTPDDIRNHAPETELKTALSGSQTDHDRWHVRKDRTRFWGTNTVQPMFDAAGALLGFSKLVRDITVQHLALEALSDSEERLRLLIESVDEYAIFSVALDGTVTSWNTGAQATFGYLESEIVGQPITILSNSDDERSGLAQRELREATVHGSAVDERWLVRKDGTKFLAASRLTQLKRGADGSLRGFVKIAHDVTERKRAADELRRRALNDQLTKLPNRVAFFEHVKRAIASMKRRPQHQFAVLFIDLDHFKTVNDTYGHIIADTLLEFTARRLEECVRSRDIIARLGGDEFAILLNGINGIGDAIDAGERIATHMSLPITVDGYDVHVSASIGVALGRPEYEKPEDILRDADTAMYVAKTQGRARTVLFEPEMAIHSRAALDLETDLRHALERGEMRVVYQPIIELVSRRVAGFEALVRWQHPRRGLLVPSDFIPGAERSEAIIAIDRWVLRVAAEQLRAWRARAGTERLQISVNFSSQQFSRTDLVDAVAELLAQCDLEPRALRIELTETGLLERSDETTRRLAALRTLGVALDIDDFGMGYASLDALGHMTLDALKIDRSFIAGIGLPNRLELIRAIATLAHNLGLAVIAEGIETAEQFAVLEAMRCDFGQGFWFAQPLDAVAAGEFLTASYAPSAAT